MVVAMVVVRMMQVTIDQIVDVIAVRHRFMPTSWPMYMTGLVPGATMIRCAAVGVPRGYFDHVLVDVVAVRMVQMTIVKVINMASMADREVPTIGPMSM
jgi:hypothetical protein